MRSLFLLVCVLCVGCGDTIVNIPVPGGTTVPGGPGVQVPRQTTEYTLCGVRIFFTTENGRGAQIQFDNPTGAVTITKVMNNRTGALVAQNCVWPRSSDVSAATFQAGDQFRIVVLQGQGQILSRLCTDIFSSFLNQFRTCDEAIFNFVASSP